MTSLKETLKHTGVPAFPKEALLGQDKPRKGGTTGQSHPCRVSPSPSLGPSLCKDASAQCPGTEKEWCPRCSNLPVEWGQAIRRAASPSASPWSTTEEDSGHAASEAGPSSGEGWRRHSWRAHWGSAGHVHPDILSRRWERSRAGTKRCLGCPPVPGHFVRMETHCLTVERAFPEHRAPSTPPWAQRPLVSLRPTTGDSQVT